jgi:hypothetical protein
MKTNFSDNQNWIFSGMNWIYLMACAIATLLAETAPNASAALLSYEGFDYPTGDSVVGKTGGTGFSAAWIINGGAGVATNQADSLSYRDSVGNTLVTSGGSLFLQGVKTDNGAAAQPSRTLPYSRGTNTGGTDNTNTWISFLAVRQGPSTNVYPFNPYPRSASISLYNTGAERLGMGNTTPANGGISNVVSLVPLGNTNRPSSVIYSQTNLIVVRVDHITGAALDNAHLFVNPPLGIEPSINDAATNTIGQFDFTFNRIRPFAGGDRSLSVGTPYAEVILDEIRIGETFADVTPFNPALQIMRNGSNVVLTWSGTNHLQSSSDVVGTYTDVTGATSPFTTNTSNASLFFRLFN